MSNGNGRGSEQGHMTPTMNAEQFAAYMEKRLTLYDEIELLDRAGMELRLRANGADVTADLSSFYSSYARDPGQIDVVFETFVRAMLGIVPDRSTSDYAALAGSIYPMIKPLEMLVEVRERRLPARGPWLLCALLLALDLWTLLGLLWPAFGGAA